jgi:hypothetical protein
MSTVRIKHWDNKKGFMPLGVCAQPNCGRQGDEISNGKVYCSRHLTLTLVMPKASMLRPGQGFGR